MAHKTLVNGTAYDISGGRTLINGTAYGIAKGRTLVGGTGYDVAFGTPISTLAVGESIFLNVGGVAKEFIIVHQGLPSSMYDNSCNGTWLLMKDLYEQRAWDSYDNDYENSDIHAYLNSTFLGLFDSDIQSAIKQVKIPYSKGQGTDKNVQSGANGLSAKVFLISSYELGFTTNTNGYLPIDGACLDYFNGASNEDRYANLDGTRLQWWTRSASSQYITYVWCIRKGASIGGAYGYQPATDSWGVRPMIILPSDFTL